MGKTNKKQYHGYEVKQVTSWICPTDTGVPVITMPNVPRYLHGPGHQPRTILGKTTWDRMRKRCYFEAGYKCEVCGCEPPSGKLHAHELFDIDYGNGVSTFRKCVALCEKCHITGVHTGRALTLYKEGNPTMPKNKLLDGAENVFSLVNDYNKKHPQEPELRVYATFLDYLSEPELADPMRQLIDKYKIKFYHEDVKKCAAWGQWTLVIGGKEYSSLYKSEKEWREAMVTANSNDAVRRLNDELKKFSGGVYDEINKIIKNS